MNHESARKYDKDLCEADEILCSIQFLQSFITMLQLGCQTGEVPSQCRQWHKFSEAMASMACGGMQAMRLGTKYVLDGYHVQEWEGMHLSSKCNNHGSVFSDLDSTSNKNHGISSLQSETKSWFILPTSWTTESEFNECNFSPQVVLCRESKIQHFMSLGSCVFVSCWGKIHQNPTRFKAITGDDAGALASL